MIKLIGFDPASGSIVIQDNGVFLAGSLVAYQSPTWPDRIQIDNLAGKGVQSVGWADVRRLDSADPWAPADMADALGYVLGEFAKRAPVGEAFGTAGVAGLPLAQGMPVAVSRATGQLLPARADTYPLAFVVGLASADTTQGFTNQPAHGAFTLPDWTGVAGTVSLAVGQPYFLGSAGGLALSPDRASVVCLAQVGIATAPQTLIVQPRDPILL